MKKFIIINTIIILIHLIFIIINITPMTLYSKLGEINVVSIILVIFTLFIILFFRKTKSIKQLSILNCILIIPSLFLCLVYDIGESSSTNDFNNYLLFDNENIKKEALEFIPEEINGEVEYYYYFYDICRIPGYDSSYEISLKVKYNNDSYNQLKKEVDGYLYDECIKNDSSTTYVIMNNYKRDNNQIIRKTIVKLISFNDKDKSVVFECLNINGKIDKDNLSFFNKNIDKLLI